MLDPGGVQLAFQALDFVRGARHGAHPRGVDRGQREPTGQPGAYRLLGQGDTQCAAAGHFEQPFPFGDQGQCLFQGEHSG